MKGVHEVRVESKRVRYRFLLRRNLTVIRGESATGKTTLIDMIQQFVNNPSGSAISLRCDKKCFVLSGSLWKSTLQGVQDSIVFIDEGNEFVVTEEFARVIAGTDNYYVIVTRESLPALPYSMEEIYGIHEAGKYGTLQQTYNEFYRIYTSRVYDRNEKPELIITEDSNAGFRFFERTLADRGIEVKSAGGKSNIFRAVVSEDKQILIIADGAAFGPEMEKLIQLFRRKGNLAICLPESFEWMILSTGMIDGNQVKAVLEAPSEYIESREYFSWERFFTALLISQTQGTYLQYSKRQLNPAYLTEQVAEKILKQVPINIEE